MIDRCKSKSKTLCHDLSPRFRVHRKDEQWFWLLGKFDGYKYNNNVRIMGILLRFFLS